MTPSNLAAVSTDHLTRLTEKISEKTARIAVVGQGYVGFPLAMAFCEAGFSVLGLEEMPSRLESLKRGGDYISGKDEQLKGYLDQELYRPTSSYEELSSADVIIICVPTPLNAHREPDISYVDRTATLIAQYGVPGQLVILESTTYPGTTDEIIVPKLLEAGRTLGQDCFVAYSPERVDIGNARYGLRNTPKVIGGVTPECTEVATNLYLFIIDDIVRATSPRVAEMEKLLENTYRCVNIALINELALLCKRMDIDIWEVIELAATKPYGFTPFYPGPGLGGHCIPIDPYYLTWKAREFQFNTRFIELAGEVNWYMPFHVVEMVQDALASERISINGARILVIGLAYKRDIADWRESPSLRIIDILRKKKAVVDYHDELIPELREADHPAMTSVSLDGLQEYDCVVIATNHSYLSMERIANEARLVVDTRNAMRGYRTEKLWRI